MVKNKNIRMNGIYIRLRPLVVCDNFEKKSLSKQNKYEKMGHNFV